MTRGNGVCLRWTIKPEAVYGKLCEVVDDVLDRLYAGGWPLLHLDQEPTADALQPAVGYAGAGRGLVVNIGLEHDRQVLLAWTYFTQST